MQSANPACRASALAWTAISSRSLRRRSSRPANRRTSRCSRLELGREGTRAVLGPGTADEANYKAAVERLYKDHAPEILKVYAPASDNEVEDVARSLASDRFIAFGTWKWTDVAAQTGGKPVYRYFYERPRPKMTPEFAGATANLAGGVTRNSGPAKDAPPPPQGAVHSAEIEYAMGNLEGNKVYALGTG